MCVCVSGCPYISVFVYIRMSIYMNVYVKLATVVEALFISYFLEVSRRALLRYLDFSILSLIPAL